MLQITLSIICTLFSFQTFAQDVSFETVVDLVQNQNVTTLEGVLAKLPESYRENYTLMHTSKSIQDSSYENPRVIMFGKNAKFILTFNGEPAQRGYQRLEMLQFRDAENKWEMRSISFRNNTAEVSQKDPSMCLGCHGQSPRPIWSPYAKWPGAYGAIDDFMFAPYSSQAELDGFSKFIANIPAHPRYKHLVRRTDLSPMWPYRANTSGEHAIRANDRFGNLIAGLQSQYIAPIIAESSFFKDYPNTVLLTFLWCDEYYEKAGELKDPSYQKGLMDLFQKRFPKESYPNTYKMIDLALTPFNKVDFMLEKLILNDAKTTWDLNFTGMNEQGRRYHAGTAALSTFAVGPALEKYAKETGLLKYKPNSFTEWFDNHSGIGPGKKALELNGVGENYDSVIKLFDDDLVKKECKHILARSLKELAK